MATTYDSKSIRTATVTRKTAETNISCTISLDHAPGVKQDISVKTGIGFLDHVGLSQLAMLDFRRSMSSAKANTDGTHFARLDVPCSGKARSHVAANDL